jgi:hypothetical protein
MARIRTSVAGALTVDLQDLEQSVYNASGGSLSAGDLVYISGATANGIPNPTKADADDPTRRAQYVVIESIANNSFGRVRKAWLSTQTFDTSGGSVGDPVYLSGTAGSFTLTAPAGKPQIVGWVTVVSATVGQILFQIEGGEQGAASDVQQAEVSLTNAQVLALRATPIQMVAAPGAGKVLQFLGAELFFDYTAAYTESDDNLVFRYTDGSGAKVSEEIETTGFLDATADTATNAIPKPDVIVAKTGCDNKAIVLHNSGDGEFGGGNAANVVRVRVIYRIVAAGW